MAGTPQPARKAQGHEGDPKAQDSYLLAACAGVGGPVSPSLASCCTPRTLPHPRAALTRDGTGKGQAGKYPQERHPERRWAEPWGPQAL